MTLSNVEWVKACGNDGLPILHSKLRGIYPEEIQ
jgi:hypothetical protein